MLNTIPFQTLATAMSIQYQLASEAVMTSVNGCKDLLEIADCYDKLAELTRQFHTDMTRLEEQYKESL